MSKFTLELPVIADLVEGDEITTAEALGLTREQERSMLKVARAAADSEDSISVSLQSVVQNEKVTEINELAFAILEFGRITQRRVCASEGHNMGGGSVLGAIIGKGATSIADLADMLRRAREKAGNSEESTKKEKDAGTDGAPEQSSEAGA